MKYLLSVFCFLFLTLLSKLEAQCPTLSFSTDTEYCKGELVSIANSSLNVEEYFWDFCVGDNLNQQPFSERILIGENIGSPFDLKVLFHQSEYYGYLANNANGDLIRLDFGDSISNAPTVVNIGTPTGATVSKAGGIDIESEGVNYYGLMTGFNSSRLYFLNYGSDPLSVPEATDVSSGLGLLLPSDVEILESEGNYYAFVIGNGSGIRPIIRLNYGNSLLNTPVKTEFNVGTSDQLFKIDFAKECDSWYGFVTSRGTGEVYRLAFGTDLGTDPAIDEITSGTGLTLDNPVGLSVSLDDSVYIHLTSRNAFSYMLSLPSLSSTEIRGKELEVGNSNDFGIETFREGSEWVAYRISSSSRIDRLSFPSDCEAEPAFSEEPDPQVRFFRAGEHQLLLQGTSLSGENSFLSKSLNVSLDTVPSISFTQNGLCVSNSILFESMIEGGSVSSYLWDFGDGSSSTEENPMYEFASTGTYTVRLDVSDGSCDNFIEQEITIYPEPSTPNFDFSAGSLCSNSVISFENLTDETGISAVVEYEWDFNGEATSTVSNPEYTFTTSGAKTVGLLAIVPGCTTMVYSEEIIIEEGPLAAFDYVNNCFGEAIDFTDQSIGSDIVSYSWYFDDGNGSTDQNTTHTYASTGSYEVSITVTNSSGCIAVFTQEIVVSNDPKADFMTGESVENLPVQFISVDLTGADDSVIGWFWDFAGLGTSIEANPEFTFSSPGSYTIELTVSTSQGCDETIEKNIVVNQAQCPTLSFSTDTEYCKGELVSIANSSLNVEEYFWDFCLGDNLNQQPSSERILIGENLGSPFDLKILFHQSEYYGYLANNSNGDLIRLDFGDSISNTPIVVNVGAPSGSSVSNAGGIDIENEAGNFYGLMTGFNSGHLYFLNYGPDPLSVPEATDISSGLGLLLPSDVEILESEGNYYAFVIGNGSGIRPIIRLNYGSSLLNTPIQTEFNIGISDQLFKIDFAKDCDSWYGFVTSRGTGEVYRLNFGTDLGVDPMIDEMTSGTGLTLDNPVGISVSLDDSVYIHLTSRNAFSYVLSLPSLSSTEIRGKELEVGNSNDFGIETFREGSEWVAYRISSSSRIDRLSFPSDCEAEPAFSEEPDPQVRFFRAGEHQLLLQGTSLSGENSFLSKSLNVSLDTVPSISFTQNGLCVSNSILFESMIEGGSVSSYLWDFGGGSSSTEENPTYQFPAIGTYTVRLDVSDGTCTNFIEQEITIYPEPPVPSFDILSATFCVGSEFMFTNTSDETGLEEVISYSWSFGTDTELETKDALFVFTTPGTKTITLTSSIPGCEQSFQQEIEILEGPTSSFSSNVVCEQETTTFSNASVDALSYHWDFGDGFASTSENPTHLYADAGSYMATLIVTDANGCTDEFTEEVIVTSIPQVNFDFELSCSAQSGVQFTDMTTVEGSDLIGWTWSVDGEEVSSSQNPVINFETSGLKVIQLTVQSANGCEFSYQEEVEILPSPQPDFSFSIGCQGEISSFTDITSEVGNAITQWVWLVEGVTYTTEEVNHVFESSGVFEITLEVTGENFCSEIISKTVEVNQLPIVDFSMIGDCSNELIVLTDASTYFEDAITSRRWILDGQQIGNGNEVLLEELSDGLYNLELEVETEGGCIVSTTQELVINPLPSSVLGSSSTYGLPGDVIAFANSSIGGSSYQWLLNGTAFSTDLSSESITFSESGTHTVSLVAFNSFGCSDTSSVDILIAIPEVDLAIGRFEIVDQNGTGKIFVEIQNLSNLPIEVTEAQIELENKFSVSEQVLELIEIGESKLVSLNVGVPLNISEPAFVCINLVSQYVGYADINPLNNEKCLSLKPTIQVEAPYPNPVRDQFRMKVVLPEGASAKVKLINSTGKIEQNIKYDLDAGLNNIFIDMTSLSTGIYFINIKVMGKIISHRIIKL